jgi:hypothetical protein
MTAVCARGAQGRDNVTVGAPSPLRGWNALSSPADSSALAHSGAGNLRAAWQLRPVGTQVIISNAAAGGLTHRRLFKSKDVVHSGKGAVSAFFVFDNDGDVLAQKDV